MRARAERDKVVLERPSRGGWGAPTAEPYETLTVAEAEAFARDLDRAIAAASGDELVIARPTAAGWEVEHRDACPCPDPLRTVDPACPLHGYDASLRS